MTKSDFWNAYRVSHIPTGDPANCSRDENVMSIRMTDFAVKHRNLHEALYQLHKNGPVWDGDVICKSHRDELLDCGACAKVCVKGEDGYNACTYLGRNLLEIYDWLFGALGHMAEDARRQRNTLQSAQPLGAA